MKREEGVKKSFVSLVMAKECWPKQRRVSHNFSFQDRNQVGRFPAALLLKEEMLLKF
jgi:hypothetical protein